MRPFQLRAVGTVLLLAITTLLLAPAAAAAPPLVEKTVNLNTAGLEELMSLPGIGAAYAQRIIEYREKNGPYKRVEDLLNVKGIGEKTFEKIRARLTVGKG